MKKLFFTLLLLITFPLMASHIVGGEFELLHMSGNNYKLNMILYFDLLHGSAGARDASVTASIWRKSDNRFMQNVFMSAISETAVGYTQPLCSHGELQTSKITYTAVVQLTPEVYNDPAGYYISWQRCCRNYSITNIFSNDPASSTNNAGQTFYLEFPPVVKNGAAFINSSPRLFPPLNDYACPYRPYYVNFAGVDDDGDSLVYTMTTPLNTTSAAALPDPSPGPYPRVTYRPAFNIEMIMGGSPDLSITLDGFLTVTPRNQGLYVFAVKIEQFRNKQKIGESRRDFQMLVTDGCEPDEAPIIKGKAKADLTFNYTDNMNITFDNTTGDADRCIQVSISDPDSQLPAHGFSEKIKIGIFPIGFKASDLNGVLPSVTSAVLTNGATKEFSICFPKCPLGKAGSYTVGIVAFDNACSLPRTDTLKVHVTVQPPPNSPPVFTVPASMPFNATLNESEQMTWPFTIVDADLDSMEVRALTDGFVLADAGMTVKFLTNKKGLITGTLSWNAFCNIYDFTKRTSYQVRIVADDLDECNLSNAVIGIFNLKVILPGFADVFIDTDLTPDPNERKVLGITRKLGESLSFNVTSRQADGDVLLMSGRGTDFLFSTYQMKYTPLSGVGPNTAHFQWDILCGSLDLTKRDIFNLQFIVLDNTNKCKVPKMDTVEVQVHVVPPDNNDPILEMVSLNDVPIVNDKVTITLGQSISLNLLGTDTDSPTGQNALHLNMIEATGTVAPAGYTFAGVSGKTTVQAPFLWTPDCAIFKDGVYSNDYTFKFSLIDEGCIEKKGDTITLHVTINDVVSNFALFSPPNVITPNGDDCNDYLAMEGIGEDAEAILNCDRSATDALINLPKDNCIAHFQFIKIYNRWGKEVFHSADRKFRWYAQNQDMGVYFYTIEFGSRQFKGTVSVRP